MGGEISKDASAYDQRDGAEALPHGWEELIDPKSGKVYYANKALDLSQWVHPAPAKGRAMYSSAEDATRQAATTGYQEDFFGGSSPGDDIVAPSGEPDALESDDEAFKPFDGWWKTVCKATGRPFYYNGKTGTTQWARPQQQEGFEATGYQEDFFGGSSPGDDIVAPSGEPDALESDDEAFKPFDGWWKTVCK